MTANAAPESLALYHFRGCPYCEMVRRTIGELAIDVEYRDIHGDPQHREDLLAARGRQTVPVLAITDRAGEVQWMPESSDIIHWLRERNADGTLAK